MINVERFAQILARRWKRNPAYRACDLPELKSLSGYSEAMYPEAKKEACAAIELRAREIFAAQTNQEG